MKLYFQAGRLTLLASMASLTLASSHVFAMDSLSDKQLAQTSGQDGITINMQNTNAAVSFDQARWIDRTGFTQAYGANTISATSAASMTLAFQTANPQNGILFLNSTGGAANNLMRLDIDTDGGTTKTLTGDGAFVNVALSLASDLKTIRLTPFSIYMAPTNAPTTSIISDSVLTRNADGTIGGLKAGTVQVISVDQGANINFMTGKPLKINVQLGNTPQGHMIQLGGSLQSINIPVLKLISNNSAVASSALSLGVSLTAADTVNGFRLGSMYGDIQSSGLVLGYDGTTDKLNVVLSGVTAGTAGASDPTVFNGLPNSSMGNIGATGLQVQNMKVGVKGM